MANNQHPDRNNLFLPVHPQPPGPALPGLGLAPQAHASRYQTQAPFGGFNVPMGADNDRNEERGLPIRPVAHEPRTADAAMPKINAPIADVPAVINPTDTGVAQPATNAQPNRPAPPPASKSVTCHYWAQGICKHPEGQCPKAHHLFPTVSERTTSKASKLEQCRYGNGCRLPRDVRLFTQRAAIRNDPNEHGYFDRDEALESCASLCLQEMF